MSINFGVLPVRASFTLSDDADFYQTLTTSDGSSFPASATLTLIFTDEDDDTVATYSATISASTATFQEDKTDVATLLGLVPTQGRLYYDDGDGGPELLLAQGPIHDLSP